MELKEFIEATLSEITLAVQDSQKNLKGSGVIINPSTVNDGHIDISGKGKRVVSEIDFNVVVSTEKEDSTNKGLSVIAGAFGAGVSAKDSNSNSLINRIQFKIPVSFPVDDDLNEITKYRLRLEKEKKDNDLRELGASLR